MSFMSFYFIWKNLPLILLRDGPKMNYVVTMFLSERDFQECKVIIEQGAAND